MRSPYRALAAQASVLAREMPGALVSTLADEIASCQNRDWDAIRLRVLQVTPHPRFRGLIEALLTTWHEHASTVTPESVSMALLAAMAAAEDSRRQVVELVWTGPDVRTIPLRRTGQALLQVIEAAESELLIVSFAVYHVPAIMQALVRETQRGVHVRICVESSESGEQHLAYDALQALGQEVIQRADVYVWPGERRPVDQHGKTGSLHAKCAVADDRTLFISSANLTQYAMNLNMELGVLIRGGPLPGQVATHFGRLIADNVLVRAGVGSD